jgi:hypothetical protein
VRRYVNHLKQQKLSASICRIYRQPIGNCILPRTWLIEMRARRVSENWEKKYNNACGREGHTTSPKDTTGDCTCTQAEKKVAFRFHLVLLGTERSFLS